MVELTVYSMTAPFDATKYLQDLKTYVEERRQRTDYFFSSGDIQQSTAFTIVDKTGEWSDFYLGQVLVRANGNLAFLPHASLSGTVDGESIGQFATEMLADGGNPNRFLRTVLGGDDVLRGGGGDDILYGHGGADHLYGGAGNDKLYGGDGDDFIVYDGTYLYYDRDGSGSAAAVRLAGIYNEGGGTHPDLNIDDFFAYRGDHDAVARSDVASGHALLPQLAPTMSEPIHLCLA